MKHAERVHSRSQLLDKVWGDHVFIEERTVDVHVKRCARRWAPRVMVETVRGAGYRLTAQPPEQAAVTGLLFHHGGAGGRGVTLVTTGPE
jgi:DNA-binding winged helix-turn-helix (wHTH) protein